MNMSFTKTKQQFRDKTKTVTRRPRKTWLKLKVGDIVQGIVQGQGLAKGAKVERLHRIRILSKRPELLCWATPDDIAKEGFPGMGLFEFVCDIYGGLLTDEVWRIEFEHLEGEA